MAFEQVNSKLNYGPSYKGLAADTVLVTGHYMETFINKKYKNPVHVFKLEDGTKYALNSAGSLDAAISRGDIEVGDFARITFLGKEVAQSGQWQGQECNQFKIEIDKERSLPASQFNVKPQNGMAAAPVEQALPVDPQPMAQVQHTSAVEQQAPVEQAEPQAAAAPKQEVAQAPVGKATTTTSSILDKYRSK